MAVASLIPSGLFAPGVAEPEGFQVRPVMLMSGTILAAGLRRHALFDRPFVVLRVASLGAEYVTCLDVADLGGLEEPRLPAVGTIISGQFYVSGRLVAGHGASQPRCPDPLRGLLYCPCGRMIRADGSNRSGRQRSHPEPCRQWTGAQRRQSRLWEEPVKAQLRGLEVSDATIVQVVAALSATVPISDDLRKARRERQRKELALAYAAGKLSEASFLSAVAALNAEGDPLPPPAEQVTTTDVSRFLRKVSDTIIKLDTAVAVGDISPTELAGVWEELTHAIYQRIIITGATFVGVELTPAAKAHGLQALLPEEVEVGEANWRARTGSDPRYHAHSRTPDSHPDRWSG